MDVHFVGVLFYHLKLENALVFLELSSLQIKQLLLELVVVLVDIEDILNALIDDVGKMVAESDFFGVFQKSPLGEVEEVWKEFEEGLFT